MVMLSVLKTTGCIYLLHARWLFYPCIINTLKLFLCLTHVEMVYQHTLRRTTWAQKHN